MVKVGDEVIVVINQPLVKQDNPTPSWWMPNSQYCTGVATAVLDDERIDVVARWPDASYLYLNLYTCKETDDVVPNVFWVEKDS